MKHIVLIESLPPDIVKKLYWRRGFCSGGKVDPLPWQPEHVVTPGDSGVWRGGGGGFYDSGVVEANVNDSVTLDKVVTPRSKQLAASVCHSAGRVIIKTN